MKEEKKPSTPHQKWANLCDSLADDVLAGHIKIDEETNQRASRIAHAAINQALKESSRTECVFRRCE